MISGGKTASMIPYIGLVNRASVAAAVEHVVGREPVPSLVSSHRHCRWEVVFRHLGLGFDRSNYVHLSVTSSPALMCLLAWATITGPTKYLDKVTFLH